MSATLPCPTISEHPIQSVFPTSDAYWFDAIVSCLIQILKKFVNEIIISQAIHNAEEFGRIIEGDLKPDMQ